MSDVLQRLDLIC